MHKLIVSEEFVNMRLDRYLRNNIRGINQALIEKSLRKKNILLNNEKVKASSKLKVGDEVLLKIQIKQEEKQRVSPAVNSKDIKQFKQWIIFEDKSILVINKPASWATQGGSNINKSLNDIIKQLPGYGNLKIVHRLDIETSGVLIFAKGVLVAQKLAKQFQENTIKKTYLALTSGSISPTYGLINIKLSKNHFGRDESKKEYKTAVTYYGTIASNKNNKALLKLEPKTGRMHQLRLHCSLQGCPIIGDKKYGGERANRLMLHAFSVEFRLGDKEYNIKASLPDYFIEKCIELNLDINSL